MKRFAMMVLAAVMLLGLCSAVFAASSGSITGMVVDKSGTGIVAGATVELYKYNNREKEWDWTASYAVPDGGSYFEFLNLKSGKYEIDVDGQCYDYYNGENDVIKITGRNHETRIIALEPMPFVIFDTALSSDTIIPGNVMTISGKIRNATSEMGNLEVRNIVRIEWCSETRCFQGTFEGVTVLSLVNAGHVVPFTIKMAVPAGVKTGTRLDISVEAGYSIWEPVVDEVWVGTVTVQ